MQRRGKKLWSQNGEGSRIILHTFESDEVEARTVVEQIEYNRMAHQIPWGEQAILFRTNLQSRAIETALRQGQVRYHLIGGQSYFDRREVRDFMAYLKTFINPHDDVSFLRIANVPARGLSDVTMERLLSASQERSCSVFAAMKHADVRGSFSAKTVEAIDSFVGLVERTRGCLEEGKALSLRSWSERFLDETGYLHEVRRLEKNDEVAESRLRNLKELMASLDGGEATTERPAERLLEFLEQLSLDGDRKDEKDKAGDAVTLITMHSCKGLEYPHVFIVGLEDGLLPHSRSKVEGTLDEERRLFYVAITRAMKSLTISYCTARKKYGQMTPCHPSPFLNELPEELVERGDEKGKKPVAVDSGKNLFAAMRASLD